LRLDAQGGRLLPRVFLPQHRLALGLCLLPPLEPSKRTLDHPHTVEFRLGTLQYQKCSQQRCSSMKYSVSRNIPDMVNILIFQHLQVHPVRVRQEFGKAVAEAHVEAAVRKFPQQLVELVVSHRKNSKKYQNSRTSFSKK
jgi:hypothetical protein